MTTHHATHSSAPNMLGSTLAVVASVAAVELDNLRLGRDQLLDAVPRLAGMLRDAIPEPPPANASRALLDPVKADVFSQALSASGKELKSLREISVSTREMADLLQAVQGLGGQSELVALRDFCVALSRSAQAEVAAHHDNRPSSPYRR